MVELKNEISTTKEGKNRFGGTEKHDSVIQIGDRCINDTFIHVRAAADHCPIKNSLLFFTESMIYSFSGKILTWIL